MFPDADLERAQYTALTDRARDAQRLSQVSWLASGLAAAVLLSWAIGARSVGLMLPVEIAIAFGFYAALRGRQQVKLIAGYFEEIVEAAGSRPHWFTHLRQLSGLPGFTPGGDWVMACLANAVVCVSMVFAWMYAGSETKNGLTAGLVTSCGAAFLVHSLTETSRLTRTSYAALWRQVSKAQHEERTLRVAG